MSGSNLRTDQRRPTAALAGTVGGSISGVPAFPEQLLLQLYGVPLSELCHRLSLVPISTIPALRQLPSRHHRILLAVNRHFARRPVPAAIATTPTTDQPITDPTRIDLGTLAEIMLALTTAAWFQRPCLIYLPAGSTPATATTVIHRLAADLRTPPPQIAVIDTDDPALRDRLRTAADQHRDHLAMLYRTNPDRDRPHIDTAVRYLPDIAADILDRTIRHTIVTGPVPRVRGAAIAHRLASNQGHWVDFLAHIPTPEHVLRIDAISTIVAEGPSPVRAYWSALWNTHRAAMTQPAPADLITMLTYCRRLTAGHATPRTAAAGPTCPDGAGAGQERT